ncbi:hypothetical protein E2562_020012 [Oryza meyeriana var. granulata]|uniref:Uncharacterized protein n=1 Tax=Oryza meyeriana var. granulata TaxID=110450 RepID=A0A6G1FAJ8_9ORYZ|nr:hypothetical protein E2562_020012 [Oryza meyeriana var. granulata]
MSVVHVIPPLRFVPSPCNHEQVPAAQVAREAAEAYARDRHAGVQEVLRSFRRIFAAAAAANATFFWGLLKLLVPFQVATAVVKESIEPLLDEYRPPGIKSLKRPNCAMRINTVGQSGKSKT